MEDRKSEMDDKGARSKLDVIEAKIMRSLVAKLAKTQERTRVRVGSLVSAMDSLSSCMDEMELSSKDFAEDVEDLDFDWSTMHQNGQDILTDHVNPQSVIEWQSISDDEEEEGSNEEREKNGKHRREK